ncbi:MAG: Ig-like domain-containing domain [Bacteroidota bacterium]
MFQLKQKYSFTTGICALVYLPICTLIISCAQVVAPGGGPVDRTPPKVVKYIPDSAQLNFNTRAIIINFDEYVQLRDLNSQLIISPPLEYTPDITVKGKTLFVELDKKEVLKPNTTYAINFGNALQDYNENNPKENFKYLFSTGIYIDSLSVRGKVRNAFDQNTEKGIIVMLYNDQSDSIVYKKQPDYFAKTAADGTFEITNIKAGNYKIAALKDANSNYKYDGESENIGFINSLVDVSKKQNILIDIFQEPTKKVYLKKYIHDSYGKISFIFNQGSDSIKVIPLNTSIPTDQLLLDFSKNKDTFNYWVKKFEKDSLVLQVKNGNKILDTVELEMIKKEEALKSRKNPLKLKLINSPNGNQGFDLNSELKLIFNNPIASVAKTSPIQLKADSILQAEDKPDYFFYSSIVKIQYWKDTTIYEDINNPGVFIASPNAENPKFKENTKYHLLIPPGTFTEIFGLTNDSIKIDFKTREEKYYGSVILKVNISETKGNYIIQLFDEKENVVRENNIKRPETLIYEYLYPLKYKLKLIYDENNNGKWDSGNYLQKKQPEKVIYYKELINIRSNWDLDLEWKVSE